MWGIMMVGMMLPSATPTTLVYTAVARKASREGTPVAPVAAFVVGYLFMWTLFSFGATLAQWGLERAALLSPMMASKSPALGGALLLGAGIYQLTPFKDACLEQCLVWIAAITLFVLLEKVVPHGARGGRWAGIGMILSGVLVVLGAWSAGG
jgi:predicted metal-binding membrane protein